MNKEKQIDVSNPALTLEEGDRIRIPRMGGIYSHWAMYEGKGKIIHVVKKSDPKEGSTSLVTGHTKAKIKKDDLHRVLGRGKAYKNNTHDHHCKPLPRGKILDRARDYVDCGVPYSVLRENCEHYATYMRNDDFKSYQAEKAESTAVGGFLGILVAVVALLFELAWNKSSTR